MLSKPIENHGQNHENKSHDVIRIHPLKASCAQMERSEGMVSVRT